MIILEKIKNGLRGVKSNFLQFRIENFNHLYLKIYLAICFILNSLLWILAFSIKNNIKEGLAILHYNIDFGINLLGTPSTLLVVPFFGLIIILINLLLIIIFAKSDKFKFIAHLLSAVAVASNLFLILALFLIYSINFKN